MNETRPSFDRRRLFKWSLAAATVTVLPGCRGGSEPSPIPTEPVPTETPTPVEVPGGAQQVGYSLLLDPSVMEISSRINPERMISLSVLTEEENGTSKKQQVFAMRNGIILTDNKIETFYIDDIFTDRIVAAEYYPTEEGKICTFLYEEKEPGMTDDDVLSARLYMLAQVVDAADEDGFRLFVEPDLKEFTPDALNRVENAADTARRSLKRLAPFHKGIMYLRLPSWMPEDENMYAVIKDKGVAVSSIINGEPEFHATRIAIEAIAASIFSSFHEENTYEISDSKYQQAKDYFIYAHDRLLGRNPENDTLPEAYKTVATKIDELLFVESQRLIDDNYLINPQYVFARVLTAMRMTPLELLELTSSSSEELTEEQKKTLKGICSATYNILKEINGDHSDLLFLFPNKTEFESELFNVESNPYYQSEYVS